MTNFQSLTRGAPTQRATLGDNHEGGDNRAPSCDSGFISDLDINVDKRTSDVSDNKSSALRNENLTLKKSLELQREIKQALQLRHNKLALC